MNEETNKETKEQEAEYYFIEFLFSTNKYLLQKQFRILYDALFEKYLVIYLDGREKHIDLMTISNKFKNSL